MWRFPEIYSFTFSTFLLHTSHFFYKSPDSGDLEKEEKENKNSSKVAASCPTEGQHNKIHVDCTLWLWSRVIHKSLTVRGHHRFPSNQMQSCKVFQVLHSLAVCLRTGRYILYLQFLQATKDANFLLQVMFQDLSKIKRLPASLTEMQFFELKQWLLYLPDPSDIITEPTGFRESSLPKKRKWKEAQNPSFNADFTDFISNTRTYLIWGNQTKPHRVIFFRFYTTIGQTRECLWLN